MCSDILVARLSCKVELGRYYGLSLLTALDIVHCVLVLLHYGTQTILVLILLVYEILMQLLGLNILGRASKALTHGWLVIDWDHGFVNLWLLHSCTLLELLACKVQRVVWQLGHVGGISLGAFTLASVGLGRHWSLKIWWGGDCGAIGTSRVWIVSLSLVWAWGRQTHHSIHIHVMRVGARPHLVLLILAWSIVGGKQLSRGANPSTLNQRLLYLSLN